MSGEVFVTSAALRFSESDPARIAFYPRLLERVNNVVEDWFAGPIGLSFSAMHHEYGVGVPTRSLTTEFEAPARLGDMIEHRLVVTRLGGASFALEVTFHLADGTRMLLARPVLVWCRLGDDAVTAVPIPEPYRGRMAAFLAG